MLDLPQGLDRGSWRHPRVLIVARDRRETASGRLVPTHSRRLVVTGRCGTTHHTTTRGALRLPLSTTLFPLLPRFLSLSRGRDGYRPIQRGQQLGLMLLRHALRLR